MPFFSVLPFELWRHYMHYQVYWCRHSFTKNPPTVPPSPTPKLTKREDSAAVLLIFSDPFVAPEHKCLQTRRYDQYCLQSVHVCVKPDDTENLQLGDSEAMTGSLLFQFVSHYDRSVIFKTFRFWISILQEYNIYYSWIGTNSELPFDSLKKNGVKYLRAYWGSRSCWSLYFGYMEDCSCRRCRWSTGLPKLWNWRSAFSSCLIHFTQFSTL